MTPLPPGQLGFFTDERYTARCGNRTETLSVQYLEAIDGQTPEFGDLYDELPLWSAPFGLMLLEQVSLRPGMTILDVGAGTGFLTIELAQRCGSDAVVIAVDP